MILSQIFWLWKGKLLVLYHVHCFCFAVFYHTFLFELARNFG